ncbi:helix-turn-helix domain-containing protein [Microlunatus parietis]|uniref:Transcriptional regulator with XRE-family HTH domain n=1 Tax=Microlunatus parietis TaxID=682979 RepID=A0A7Y9I698_9ACTN|nr:helix-turn-helix transcriptional regulator [Microlunatus parietis]NYE70821.1 transcriptional regulator with XRE-family HTH domain [Microlunatus parietis]
MSSAELIQAVRRRKGLTQSQLARRAGTTQSAISRIERGVESPTVDRLADLLRAMGEHLDLGSTAIDPWADEEDLAADRRRGPADRLADGIALATFITELAGSARKAPA